MRHLTCLLFLFSIHMSLCAQDSTAYVYHSYSEFLQLIQQEEDTLFEYSNAIIQFDPKTDQRFTIYYKFKDSVWSEQPVDTIHIRKHIQLQNVHFYSIEKDTLIENKREVTKSEGVWYKCRFEGRVEIFQCSDIQLFNSRLANHFRIINQNYVPKDLVRSNAEIRIQNNRITKDFSIGSDWEADNNQSRVLINNNDFIIDEHKGNYALSVYANSVFFLGFSRNNVRSIAPNIVNVVSGNWIVFEDNIFKRYVTLDINELRGFQRLQLNRNSFPDFVLLNLPLTIPPSAFIGWKQFEGQLISNNGFGPFISDLYVKDKLYATANRFKSVFLRQYYDSIRISNPKAFVGEMALRGRLYNHHKSKYDYETANQVFIDLKNLETERLAFLHRENPSFRTYFKWKINQFLKLFVDYGTEPAKAIVFALYVIMLFAAVYLFFPNSWDSHGKNRLKDRYLFFLKYLSLNKGIHDVYLEERKDEIAEGERFKAILEQHKLDAPAIFYRTALPLYKWSMAGTRTYSRIIQNFDFLKGKWKETDQKIRAVKTFLVVAIFFFAILYDLFIKVLNAVMLSINTFTTLGFGEIPIKGLPRYLAIIQGFIGWFMLTIFSVSLISQLLN